MQTHFLRRVLEGRVRRRLRLPHVQSYSEGRRRGGVLRGGGTSYEPEAERVWAHLAAAGMERDRGKYAGDERGSHRCMRFRRSPGMLIAEETMVGYINSTYSDHYVSTPLYYCRTQTNPTLHAMSYLPTTPR